MLCMLQQLSVAYCGVFVQAVGVPGTGSLSLLCCLRSSSACAATTLASLAVCFSRLGAVVWEASSSVYSYMLPAPRHTPHTPCHELSLIHI